MGFLLKSLLKIQMDGRHCKANGLTFIKMWGHKRSVCDMTDLQNAGQVKGKSRGKKYSKDPPTTVSLKTHKHKESGNFTR